MNSSWLQDRLSCALWARDSSLFSIEPQAVVLPKNIDEIIQAIQYARENNLSCTARGGGTATHGGSLTDGIVVDLSRSMRSILSISPENRYVIVEAGATLDDVNSAVRPYNLMVGADLSTHDRATIGGMIACNAAGSHSMTWGSMRENIEAIEVVLSDGSLRWLEFTPRSSSDPIIHTLFALRKKYGEVIAKETPPLMRRAGHLPLDELVSPNGIHPHRLFAGSQGTLGIVTKAKLKLVPLTTVKAAALLSFTTIEDALQSTQALLSLSPYGIELIDRSIVQEASLASPSITKELFRDDASAYVLIESLSDAATLQKELASLSLPSCSQQILTASAYQDVLLIRKEGLSLLLSRRGGKTPCGFIEDLAVPPHALVPFFTAVFRILNEHTIPFSVYGHMGSGCLHLRPFLSLSGSSSQKKLIPHIMNAIISLLKKHHGVESSEHGNGIIRSWMTPHLHSSEYLEALYKVKQAFDPIGIMNRGKLFEPLISFMDSFPPETTITFSSTASNTFFRSHAKGGLEKTLSSCTGNGRCRKGKGLMCPPFQVTRDERDSTRGRAHGMLFKTQNDPLTPDEEASLSDILSHCVQCKGCISECPSHINIAKVKEEELWRKKSFLRSWLFGHLPSLTDRFPRLSSLALSCAHTRIGRFLSQTLLGIFLQGLPKVQYRPLTLPPPPSQPTVILYIDSFTRFFSPSLIEHALTLLNALGEKVFCFQGNSCGRAFFSKGYLEQAEKEVLDTFHSLSSLPNTLPILFLEPSVWSVLHDEALDLPHLPLAQAKALAKRSHLLDHYLVEHADTLIPLLTAPLFPTKTRAHYHAHCHERALVPSCSIYSLLQSIPNLDLTHDPSASCCGMAGSFGMETENTYLSLKMGERAFHKSITLQANVIITSGLSCSQQAHRIYERTDGKKPIVLHPVECLARGVRKTRDT